MIDLITIVREVVKDELARANKEYPQFCSRHEGLGVLGEEIWELENEVKMCMANYDAVKCCVYENTSTQFLRGELERLEHKALLSACESIQVAAMCKKFKNYLEQEK